MGKLVSPSCTSLLGINITAAVMSEYNPYALNLEENVNEYPMPGYNIAV